MEYKVNGTVPNLDEHREHHGRAVSQGLAEYTAGQDMLSCSCEYREAKGLPEMVSPPASSSSVATLHPPNQRTY